MKKFILGICFLFSVLLTQAQFAGWVKNTSEEPVPYATIVIDSNQTVTANANGFFRFASSQTAVKLTVSAVGYRTQFVTVQQSTDIQIVLEARSSLMQPIEVRAIRAGEKAPFTQTKVTAAELESFNTGRDLPMLLQFTPSMIISSDAGNGVGYTSMRIRGTDGTRINMTLNGIPYNDAESQGAFFVNLPDFSSSVEDIQIQRGVGTSSNGASAFGASINLNTNAVREESYAEINNSAGSFNTWKHTVKAGSGLINDQFTVDVRLSKISSDGYIDRASTDLRSFYLSGAWLKEKSSIRLNVFSGKEKTYLAWNGVAEPNLKTNRTYNISGTERAGSPYENETDNYQQDHYQLFYNQQLGNKWEFNTAVFWSKGRGYYEEYRAEQFFSEYGLSGYEAPGGAVLDSADMIRQLWLDNNYYGQIFSLQKFTAKEQITIGGGWNRYEGKHFGKVIWAEYGVQDNHEWYRHPATKSDVNFYAKYLRTIDQHWNIFGDLQYRNVHYVINGYRKAPAVDHITTWNFINPKVGVSYIKHDWNAYASFAIANREPNRDDFEASPTQKPRHERLSNFEVGIKKGNRLKSAEINFFYMGYKDQLILTGQVNDVGAYARTNVDKSYRAGIEFQGNIQIFDWMKLNGNFTWSENRIKEIDVFYDDYDNGGQIQESFTNTTIAFSPRIISAWMLEVNPVKNSAIQLIGKYVDRQFLDNTGNKARSINDYYTQDIQAIYRLQTRGIREIVLIAQLNNVFNRLYESNGYTFSYMYGGGFITENYYYPMAGTNVTFGVNVKL